MQSENAILAICPEKVGHFTLKYAYFTPKSGASVGEKTDYFALLSPTLLLVNGLGLSIS